MPLFNRMESIKIMDNSIGTSMLLRLFPSEKDAAYAHIFKSTFLKFPMVDARGLENFNHAVRLSKEPYPKDDRPRGQEDLDSVQYHRRAIRKNGSTEPIWIALKDGKHILLDGAHRLVATHLENKRTIPAFIVRV